jgi:hypothetical protein
LLCKSRASPAKSPRFLPHLGAWRGRMLIVLLSACGAALSARAQEMLEELPREAIQQPAMGRDLRDALWGLGPVMEEAPPPGRAARFRTFRMMPGFLADPLGLYNGDDPAGAGDPAAGLVSSKDGDAPGRIQVTLGNDNPFFDFRWRGDPGGVGFYKVHSQMQLLDSGFTSLCLNCQAVTPAGLESGGVGEGPTIITPSIGWFQELGWGTALQGYVGTNVRTASDRLECAYHYGLSWQCPLPGLVNADDKRGVYLFLQALGRYRYEGENQQGRPAVWEIVPGIHWRVADSCWLSLGGMRSSLLTCSWRF